MDDRRGDSLISAIREGDLGTVKSLLDACGMPSVKLRSQLYHFLCESLLNGKEDIARLLLQRGANVNESKNSFATPLHHAAKKGYTEVVSMLLEKDALVNAKDDRNETPLHLAVVGRNLETIELLLNKMADIEAKSKKGLTPLHLAVKLLGRAKTSKAKSKRTVASRCKLCNPKLKVTTDATDATKTQASREEVAKLLLDRGADFEAQNNDGKTVLQIAITQCNFCIIARILHFRPSAVDLVKDCLGIAVKSARVKDRGVVELLVGYGFMMKFKVAKHSGLLHDAVRNGYTEIVNDLLTIGADVEAKDASPNGGALLHSAVTSGRIGIAALLVERGADVNAKDSKGKTPVLYAIENADPDMIKLLLSKGAVGRGTSGLLHTAAEGGCSHTMKMLLEKIPSLNVNAKDSKGKTPIMYAVENADPVMTKLLLSNGAAYGDMPSLFRRAAEWGCSDIMEMILAKIPGIDVNAVDRISSRSLRFAKINKSSHFWRSIYEDSIGTNYELTALHVAAAGGFARVVEILLEHNANVDSLAKRVGSPLHCSVLQRDETIVEVLLLNGAKVDAKQEDGTTPLHLAVREGNTKASKVLIKHGADVRKRNKKGLNLFHIATEYGHLKIFQTHLPDVFKSGRPKANVSPTALHDAVKRGTLKDVETLLRNGADASVQDENGETPLHYASSHGASTRVLEALLNNLDDTGVRDINGTTALHKAVQANNSAAVRLLLFHDCDVNIMNELGRTPLEMVNYENFHDGFSRQQYVGIDTDKTQSAAMIKEHVVKRMVLGLYVTSNNWRSVDLSVHKDLYDRCKKEIESMKSTKIGESKVSFYEFLTTNNRQLVIYSKYQSIAGVLDKGYHKNAFKLYCDMIEWRFRKSKIINDLMDSSARSLSALSGYRVEDYNYTEIFGYLNVRDMKNVIEAGASNEKSKKNKRSLIRVTIPKKIALKK